MDKDEKIRRLRKSIEKGRKEGLEISRKIFELEEEAKKLRLIINKRRL